MKQKETIQLQNLILNNVRKSKAQVTVFLMNGVRLNGIIKSFDEYCILIETEAGQSMIYKHNISTIAPNGKTHFPNLER